jgi:molybdate transport system substrate-binding protein
VRTHHKLLSAVMLSFALVGAACTSSNTTTTADTGPSSTEGGAGTTAAPKATGTITVSAAASLTTPFGTIGDNFKKANPGAEVKFNFDSSGTLATQIQSGAPADDFASADDASMKKLTDASLIAGTPVQFARNKLTIVVKKGNPKNVKTLADLATAGTISLCSTDAPCGKYADQILKAANVTIPPDKITRGQNVKATLTAVSEGDADAGIVYVTDATGDKIDKVVIPDEANAIANYPIAVVEASTNQATAQAFIDYVLSPAGQDVLKQAGFLPPA